jgi:hypothetical protein
MKGYLWAGSKTVQGGKRSNPSRSWAGLPSQVDPVGTLRTGYPHVQASSQDNSSFLPTGGSSEAAMCPHGSASRLSGWGSSGAAMCHLGSSSHLLAQGSSGAAT